MSSLIVPDTGVELYDGAVVMLVRFPNMKWILHNGWYTYQNQTCTGWYFSSIPANTILPVSQEDLKLITVISNNGNTCCPPKPFPPECNPCPPRPPRPVGIPFTHHMAEELNRAFISVNTLAQRNELNKRLLPDGKLVRVNDVNGEAKYYVWDQSEEVWKDADFGSGEGPVGDFLTKEEADQYYLPITALEWEKR